MIISDAFWCTRSSHHEVRIISWRPFANFGMEVHQQLLDSRTAFEFEPANRTRHDMIGTSHSPHWLLRSRLENRMRCARLKGWRRRAILRSLATAFMDFCFAPASLVDPGPGRPSMPMNKPHLEFLRVDLAEGWATPPGYPDGIKQKILASDIDERRKMGSRTRLL